MRHRRDPVLEPHAQHQRLQSFVGTWIGTGVSFGGVDQDPQHPRMGAVPWRSTELAVWNPLRCVVVQRETTHIGTAVLQTHTVLGYDEARDRYFAHFLEEAGHHVRYDVVVADRRWTFTSELERGHIEFSPDGGWQTVLWEWRACGDTWLPLIERVSMRSPD